MNKVKLIKFIKATAILIWIAVPFLLWFLPADYFDTGRAACLSKVLLDRECPGCGLTRAVQHAMHFEFTAAWEFNKLVVIIFPLMVMIYFHVIGRYFGKEWFPFLKPFYMAEKKKKNS
ncbi:MAG: hypothetical protein Fur0041_03860 [Bacteroidia bacterium]